MKKYASKHDLEKLFDAYIESNNSAQPLSMALRPSWKPLPLPICFWGVPDLWHLVARQPAQRGTACITGNGRPAI